MQYNKLVVCKVDIIQWNIIHIVTRPQGYSIRFGAKRLTMTSNKFKYFVTCKIHKNVTLLKWMKSQSSIKQSPLLKYSQRLQGSSISRSVSTPALGQDGLYQRLELQLKRVGDHEL